MRLILKDDQFFDTSAEKNILRNLIKDEVFCRNSFLHQLVVKEHFTSLFHIDSFKTVEWFVNKFGSVPNSLKYFKKVLTKFTTPNDSFKTKDAQLKVWYKSAQNLFIDLAPGEKRELKSNLSLVEELRKSREVQRFLITSEKLFRDGNISDIINDSVILVRSSRKIENTVMQGNIVEDFSEHIRIMEMQSKGIIQPVMTGIYGVKEYDDGERKIISLDELLLGGLFPGEMTYIIGENNIGKSFMLQDIPYVSASKQGKNVVLFTIEMNKIKAQRRLYSRLTKIPYSAFKTGKLSKTEIDYWKECLDWWKENCGIYEVCSFDKGATVIDVDNKLKEIEDKYGESFELVSIDYLNDMQPTGKYLSSKNWDAQGEISWELGQLSKYWNNHSGIAVITAGQKKSKSSSENSSDTEWTDGAFSPLPAQHATIGIGLGQDKYDKSVGRIKLNLFKNRDGEKDISFYMYPDFSQGKLHSIKRSDQFYNDEPEIDD